MHNYTQYTFLSLSFPDWADTLYKTCIMILLIDVILFSYVFAYYYQ